MSYTKHHCIIFIGCTDELKKIRKIAREMFNPKMVSTIIKSPVNITRSLYIGPDGSGEGWNTSNEYDKKRESFYKAIKDFLPFVYAAEIIIEQDNIFGIKNIKEEDTDA